MYVSPAVRSMREHPVEGEAVTLLVTLGAAADEATVREAVADAGGQVLDSLEFETLAVRVPQESVGVVCDLDGLDRVETDDAIGMTLDGAGEDVESPE